MRTAAIAAMTLLWALPCAAQETTDRTASWFAAHPTEMNRQLDACRNDPGHARHVANCYNASQGNLDRYADEAQRRYAQMTAEGDQKQAAFWRANPNALLNRLQVCNRLPTKTSRDLLDCPAAFATAQDMRR